MRAWISILALLCACGGRTVLESDLSDPDAGLPQAGSLEKPETFERPAAPRRVTATDDRADSIRVQFEPGDSGPLSAFQVLRDGVLVATLDAAARSFDDTQVPAPTLAAPFDLSASQGTRTDGVELRWQGSRESMTALFHRYTVVAVRDSVASLSSVPADGRRVAAPVLRYEWSRDGGRTWNEAQTTLVEGALTALDLDAPAGVIQPGAARAEPLFMPERSVRLYVADSGLGAAQSFYRVRAVTSNGTGLESAPARGYRALASLKYQWQRSPDGAEQTFEDLPEATGPSWFDPAVPPDTTWHYRVVVTADAKSSALSEPAVVTTPAPVVQVASDERITCALLQDHALHCWGGGMAPTPVGQIPGQYKSVTADYTVCALRLDDRMECWGSDAFETAPRGPTSTLYSAVDLGAPLCMIRASDQRLDCVGTFSSYQVNQYPRDEQFLEISVGDDQICGLLLDHTVLCWGDRPAGLAKLSEEHFKHVYVNDWDICAIREDGTLWCWEWTYPPKTPPGAEKYRFVEVGDKVALTENGELFRWSGAYQYRSGALVSSPHRYVSIHDQCAVRDDGHFDCGNGKNTLPLQQEAQDVVVNTTVCALAENSVAHCQFPEEAFRVIPLSDRPTQFLDLQSYRHTCFLRLDGSPACFGSSSQLPPLPDDHYRSLAMNNFATCGLTESDRVHCVPGQAPVPQVAFEGSYTRLIAEYQHLCALSSAGVPECFGQGTAAEVPAEALDVPSIALASDGTQVCALREDGNLACWGNGQPTLLEASDVVDIAGGGGHLCGLRDNGKVRCWGGGPSESIGRYTKLRGGYAGVCGLRDDGKVVCWASGYNAQDGKLLIVP